MTPTELSRLTPEEKRVKIAEACGWTRDYREPETFHDPTREFQVLHFSALPDYFNDLNAIHKAEITLPPEPMVRYCANLYDIVARGFGQNHWEQFHDAYKTARCVFATAAQRAEAFLLTI